MIELVNFNTKIGFNGGNATAVMGTISLQDWAEFMQE